MKTRKAAVAGMFYPSRKDEIESMVSSLLERAKPIIPEGEIRALIVPHAGYIYSGLCASHGYKLLKGKDYKNIMLIGPSHFFPFYGASLSSHDYWELPTGQIKVNFKEKWLDDVLLDVLPAHAREHSIEVQIPFLQAVLKNFEIIPVCAGDTEPKMLAEALTVVYEETEKPLIVVSSDLSHFYPYDKAVKIDSRSNEIIEKLDVSEGKKIEACGIVGVLTMMHIAKQKGWKCKKIFYNNSGDTAGDKSSVVGYGCHAFYEP